MAKIILPRYLRISSYLVIWTPVLMWSVKKIHLQKSILMKTNTEHHCIWAVISLILHKIQPWLATTFAQNCIFYVLHRGSYLHYFMILSFLLSSVFDCARFLILRELFFWFWVTTLPLANLQPRRSKRKIRSVLRMSDGQFRVSVCFTRIWISICWSMH